MAYVGDRFPIEAFLNAMQQAEQSKNDRPGFIQGFGTALPVGVQQDIQRRGQLVNQILGQVTQNMKLVDAEGKDAPADAYTQLARNLAYGKKGLEGYKLVPKTSGSTPLLLLNQGTGEIENRGTIDKGSKIMTMPKESAERKPELQIVFDPFQKKYFKDGIEVDPNNPEMQKFKLNIRQAQIEPGMKERNVRQEKLSEMYKVIDFFEEKINEIPGGTGIGGRIKGGILAAEGALQIDPKVAAYNASLDGLRSQIARGLGEVGNLAEGEQRYAINLMPKITDNLETRQLKMKNFRDYITTKLGEGKPIEPIKSQLRSKYNLD